ncbi:MAG: hypothetical protein RR191_03255 [Cetobacterium sp.]|uniref:hypothetical protein n=1 Tax=unclassified Cetobacterium TaxID=2630983 RepID=UPI00163C7BA3|nr:hypothetical protein [Cetobacterium sp. 2A]MBC2855926.1 hypothetical protein [Cetobacterium sp. 2A]
MKKLIITLLLLSINLMASIDKNVENKIESDARTIYQKSRDQKDYIQEQTEAYKNILQKLNNSKLSDKDQKEIIYRLSKMYGGNYVKQNSVVQDEIFSYNKVEQKSSEIFSKLDSENVPLELLNGFKLQAKKLYPDNSLNQKKYIDGSIENYSLIIKYLKENKK